MCVCVCVCVCVRGAHIFHLWCVLFELLDISPKEDVLFTVLLFKKFLRGVEVCVLGRTGGGGVSDVNIQYTCNIIATCVLCLYYQLFLLKPEKEGLAHPDNMGHPIDFLMLPFSEHRSHSGPNLTHIH